MSNMPQPDKVGSPLGRDNEQGGEGRSSSGGAISSQCSMPKAGVVIRATVEHIGLAGETELTVNVKWPASTFCVQPGGKQAASASLTQEPLDVPGNGPQSNFDTLYGESVVDPQPETHGE